jgi:hypothetical protein
MKRRVVFEIYNKIRGNLSLPLILLRITIFVVDFSCWDLYSDRIVLLGLLVQGDHRVSVQVGRVFDQAVQVALVQVVLVG